MNLPDSTQRLRLHNLKQQRNIPWRGGVNCVNCRVRVKERRMKRHMEERCAERRVGCDECKQVVSYPTYKLRHGSNCGRRLRTCKFCECTMFCDDFCLHLAECDGLSGMLLEKFGEDCSGVSKRTFCEAVELMRGAGHVRRQDYLRTVVIRRFDLRQLLSDYDYERPMDLESKRLRVFMRRLLYCASVFGYDILDSADWTSGAHRIARVHKGRYYQYTYNLCPVDMLVDFQFMLGSDLTKLVLWRFGYTHRLEHTSEECGGIDTIVVNGVRFDFVDDVGAFKKFVCGVRGCLGGTCLNVNVSGMIVEYLYCKEKLIGGV